MAEVSDVLSSIAVKAEKLGNNNRLLQSNIRVLEAEKADMARQVVSQNQEIKALNNKNKALKIAKKVDVSEEKSSDIKLKISELVREIDKCIALLNR